MANTITWRDVNAPSQRDAAYFGASGLDAITSGLDRALQGAEGIGDTITNSQYRHLENKIDDEINALRQSAEDNLTQFNDLLFSASSLPGISAIDKATGAITVKSTEDLLKSYGVKLPKGFDSNKDLASQNIPADAIVRLGQDRLAAEEAKLMIGQTASSMANQKDLERQARKLYGQDDRNNDAALEQLSKSFAGQIFAPKAFDEEAYQLQKDAIEARSAGLAEKHALEEAFAAEEIAKKYETFTVYDAYKGKNNNALYADMFGEDFGTMKKNDFDKILADISRKALKGELLGDVDFKDYKGEPISQAAFAYALARVKQNRAFSNSPFSGTTQSNVADLTKEVANNVFVYLEGMHQKSLEETALYNVKQANVQLRQADRQAQVLDTGSALTSGRSAASAPSVSNFQRYYSR